MAPSSVKRRQGPFGLTPSAPRPTAFYQFWLNTTDADVYKFLRYFTFLDVSEIAAIEKDDAERQGRPEAQGVLAREVTQLVHGEAGLEAAQRITEALFSGSTAELSESDFLQLQQDGLPSSSLARAALGGNSITQIFTDAEVVTSGKQVKDALGRNAVIITGLLSGRKII